MTDASARCSAPCLKGDLDELLNMLETFIKEHRADRRSSQLAKSHFFRPRMVDKKDDW